MADGWLNLWQRALAPDRGFRDRAGQRPRLMEALRGLLLARTLPALAGLILGYASFAATYGRVARMEGPVWDRVLARLPDPVDPQQLKAALAHLPALPGWSRVLPWLALAAPIGVLSLWLHDAAWDHLSLWLLRGLGGRRGFRTTLVADAEALKVGTFGTLAGLLKYLPGLGLPLAVLLLPVAVYFWVLRGFALAAWHGCPLWKGVLATLLHGLIMGILVFGTLAMVVVLGLELVGPG